MEEKTYNQREILSGYEDFEPLDNKARNRPIKDQYEIALSLISDTFRSVMVYCFHIDKRAQNICNVGVMTNVWSINIQENYCHGDDIANKAAHWPQTNAQLASLLLLKVLRKRVKHTVKVEILFVL